MDLNRPISGVVSDITDKGNWNGFDVENERLVSMNMLLFTPKVFEYLENDFEEFFKNIKDKEKE